MDQATSEQDHAVRPTAGLLAPDLVARIRRLAGFALGSTLVYSWLTRASMGGCFRGVSSDGGLIDAAGQPTTEVPQCITVTLGPSWFFIAAVAIAVLVVLNHVLSRSRDVDSAIRVLDRAVLVIVFGSLAAVVIGYLWFAQLSLDDFRGAYSFLNPFLVANITIDVSPMPIP